MPFLSSIALVALASSPGPQSLQPDKPTTVFLSVRDAQSSGDLSIKSKGGEATVVGVPSPGWVEVELRAQGDASSLDLKIKGPSGTSRHAFEVVSPLVPSLSLDIHPRRLTLGRGVGVIKVVGEHLPDGANIGLKASRGSLGDLQQTADGWVATWKPPARMNKPGVVVFTAADESRPDGARAWGRLELGAPETVTVNGPMQGQIALEIDDRSYPAKALGQRSKATFDITRYPSATTATATILSLDDGESTEQITLPSTGQPELMFAPTPAPMQTPAGAQVTLWLAAVDAAGQTLEDLSSIEISGPGRVEREAAEGGWIALKLTTPIESAPWSVTARVGESLSFVGAQSRPDLPRAELLMPGSDGAQMAVLARMRSSQGQAWRGRVSVWGGAFEALMADTDASGSTPALDTMANPESPGIACVEPVLGTGSGAVEKVVSWVEKPSLSPGETTRLFAVALDAWGLPVLTPIALEIDGESVPVLNTSPSGVAQAVWTGPDATGLSMLSSTAADQRDEAVLRVGTKFTTRLGSVGTAQERIEAEAWRNAVRCVELISAPPQAEGPAAIDSKPPEAPESPEPTAVPETTETSAPDTGQAPEEPSPWGSEEPSPWGDP